MASSSETLRQLLEGSLPDPDADGRSMLAVPTRSVTIEGSLAGTEAELVKGLDLEPPFAVVSDPRTHAVLGARVERALASIGRIDPLHLGDHPKADRTTADLVLNGSATAGSLIAVGSGTINDLCKVAAARQGKRCAVFATAPSMNGYTSVNASITVGGLKKTLPAVAPEGVFMDLRVLSEAPPRMIRSGLGDSICRPTAQADWLLSHLLLDTPYREAPFLLLAEEEPALFGEPEALLAGDLEAMGRLARTLVLSGLGMTLCGGSYPASQGEHLISHHIEMMPPPGWVEAFHGEQIAVAACVMARLQARILSDPRPQLAASTPTRSSILAHFGGEVGPPCWQEFERKRLDAQAAEALDTRLQQIWPELCERMAAVTLAPERLLAILSRAGVPVSFKDIGLTRDVFRDAVQHAREIRNRYTFLDLAADSGKLDADALL